MGDQPRHRRDSGQLGARPRIADPLPDDDPNRLAMRIAPRTMLCVTDFRSPTAQRSRGRFAELRELCAAADDKASLAIGMMGPTAELLYAGRLHEGSRVVRNRLALLESIGDPDFDYRAVIHTVRPLVHCR